MSPQPLEVTLDPTLKKKATKVLDGLGLSADQIAGLIADARRVGQTPVTTEKDFVRVRGLGIDEASIHTFPVAMTFSNERALADLLRGALTRARARRGMRSRRASERTRGRARSRRRRR